MTTYKEREEEGEGYYFKIANHLPFTKEVRKREKARVRFVQRVYASQQAMSANPSTVAN